jgi:hypothetical protein
LWTGDAAGKGGDGVENKADLTTTYCFDVVGNLVKIRYPDGRILTGEAADAYVRDKSQWGKPPSDAGGKQCRQT